MAIPEATMAEAGTLPAWLQACFEGRIGPALRYRTEFRTFSWSYPRLWDLAHRAAALYVARGLRPGDRVMLWGPNSPAYVAALLGCFLSGVVAVPIDVHSDADFLGRVQFETQARLLLRARHRPDPGLSTPTLDLDGFTDRLAAPPAGSLPALRPGDLAEVLYTSGATGRPKGTMLTHANLVAELDALLPAVAPIARAGPLTLLSILPLSHVFEQVIGLLLVLRVGATVVYLEAVKPAAIAEALRRQGITASLVVPRFLELLRGEVRRGFPESLAGLPDRLAALGLRLPRGLRRAAASPLRRAIAPDLRLFVSGGASLDPALERFWDGLGVLVLQGYGLTETSSAVTLNLPEAHRLGTVGRPLPSQRVRIGGSDEILVAGPSVTPGYYRRAAETRAAFADGWYRTGDAGRFDSAGYLVFQGRLKEIIVTSAGMKVYPEDVQAVLDRIPGVRASAVVEWQARVHAVLLLAPEAAARARQIVEDANHHLSSSQQILGYTVWPGPDFPRTAIGKVRRGEVVAAIGELQVRRPAARAQPAGPLPAIIARLTHRPPAEIQPSDALGPDLELDSVGRMELLMLVEEELGRDVDEEAVTADTTVGELERVVAGRRPARRRAHLPRWSRSAVARALRGLIQRGLVFPFVRRFVQLEVRGLEYLEGLRGPVIFAANHTSRLDVPACLLALPERFRDRLCPAARAEYFEAPGHPLAALLRGLLFDLVALAFDAFTIPQYRGFRPSLRYAGDLVDHGYSLLVFPEGRQTTTGRIGGFKEGIGVLVDALRVPVVPVRLAGLYALAAGPTLIPRRRGRATVSFGPPLVFHDESPDEIARRVEAAVRAL